MSELKRHEEILELSPEDFGIWLEDYQQDILLEPTNLDECPWILMPSSSKINDINIEPDGTVVVPVKWKLGTMAIYVVGYDGNDSVKAYVSINNMEPDLATFQISQLNEIMLVDRNDDCLRVCRDTEWHPTTLNKIFPELFAHIQNEELIF